jgi:hypothetical protein
MLYGCVALCVVSGVVYMCMCVCVYVCNGVSSVCNSVLCVVSGVVYV